MAIIALGLEWHLKKSDAFRKFLITPLSPNGDIPFYSWDGENIDQEFSSRDILLFCQLPPSRNIIQKYKNRMIWIPMWDQFSLLSQYWWNKFPRNLKVIAYSEPVYLRAKKAGMPVLKVKYFPNPANLSPADWNKKRTVFYWNRACLVSPKFLDKLCGTLEIENFIFMNQTDPYVPKKMAYKLPDFLGKTEVTHINSFLPPKDFEENANLSNIFIAPRPEEGVGITYLEQLARGSAVFAYTGATMDEYIQSGENGFLFESSRFSKFLEYLFNSDLFIKRVVRRSILLTGRKFKHPTFNQDWERISHLDLIQLGQKAIEMQSQGHLEWINSINSMKEFIYS